MEPVVTLAPLTCEERRSFVAAQIADYAEWLVEPGEAPDQDAARAHARAEIEPEVEAAVQAGEQFWSAHDARGATVGWLWVNLAGEGLPPDVAFLYQILVTPDVRRRGFGAAVLAALELALAAAGRRELRLNVWDTNVAGRRLYERAGYEQVEQFTAKRQLRKRLAPADLTEA